MPELPSPSASGRAVLATGAVSLASLAGCSALASGESGEPHLAKIVLRADTEQTERVVLTLVYAQRDSATNQIVRGVHEIPASRGDFVVSDFEGTPGFYSLTVFSENHNTHGVWSFNSYAPAFNAEPLQFEVVIQRDGGIWINLNEAGSEISIPDYDS